MSVKTLRFSTLTLALSIASGCYAAPAKSPTATENLRLVDPRIGVLGGGSNVIGPSLPFGSIHPSPQTPGGSYDGYNPDRDIRGFGQLHVSGTGWGQYGNFLISPQIGLATAPLEHDSPKSDEIAAASSYQVRLNRYDILAEVAPTHSAAIYRFTFPQSDQAHIVFDASQHIPFDIATGMRKSMGKSVVTAELTLSEDGRTIMGRGNFPGGFGGPYVAYFCAEFSRAPVAVGTWRGAGVETGSRAIKSSDVDEHIGSFARFETKAGERVSMKIAVSFLSAEKARDSLQKEIPGWDYDAVKAAAAAKWDAALGAIQTSGGTIVERTIFDTALFHSYVMPRDRTGEFARFAPNAPMWDDHYAIWDTWRTLYPLYSLIAPDAVRDTVNSFIERQRVDGAVPDTFIAGVNSFREQGGNGVDMIIGDAFAKRIPGVDWTKAYSVLKHNADARRNGATFDHKVATPTPYKQTGWIPSGIMSVSFTQEYALNDFVAGQVAASLGQTADAKKYLDRSRKWENLWNPAAQSDGFSGFVMPRNADGTWAEWDAKTYGGSWGNYFYEANSWTYSYFAPHQSARLVELMGGRDPFVERLSYALEKNLLKLDNEPSFLIPQLFHHVGRPDLAAQTLHKITTGRFTLRGYPGDDDSGAMSSYYVWSKIGLFPNAGQDFYYLNGPAFDKITVRRPGGAPLEISRTGAGIYVASVKLNGKTLDRSWIQHAELNGAAKLDFTMSETPTKWAQTGEAPPSLPAAP